jgi:hypothetical protein
MRYGRMTVKMEERLYLIMSAWSGNFLGGLIETKEPKVVGVIQRAVLRFVFGG